MHDKEIESVSKLEPFERYKYFIKRVADTEVMYTLVDESGEFVLAELGDNVLLSLWSASEFAALCMIDKWSGLTVKEISLGEFDEEIIDEAVEGNWLLNIFSVGVKSGFVVNLDEFTRDLSEELKRYS
ncbi:DUF2750 domain-containing protein [Flavihumibacter solisilvae]|uniref:DUF2750 domain-containing protein n=1 Tax=Flavihumibacter solisilvae TaxID=1349421 RepID=A0A0C1KZC0_9BACT|nr:DUF2750 domain-containing protein [Flavihumibacter solisilvae]KIC92616.1 hypothetical protein OI18_21775 [Flavihumibacter solisilvae]